MGLLLDYWYPVSGEIHCRWIHIIPRQYSIRPCRTYVYGNYVNLARDHPLILPCWMNRLFCVLAYCRLIRELLPIRTSRNGSSGLRYISPSESFDIPPIYKEGDFQVALPYSEDVSRYISEAFEGIEKAREHIQWYIRGHSGTRVSPVYTR